MRADQALQILRVMSGRPDAAFTPPQLARQLGESVAQVQYQLGQLEEAGYVEQRRPNVPLYRVTQAGWDAMQGEHDRDRSGEGRWPAA
jgi:DNA-binding IclR family transcriptional regulator